MYDCFDPEYDIFPLVLLRLAFRVFAGGPKLLWWMLMLYNFRRLINTTRAVVLLQAVTGLTLYLFSRIWQGGYSRTGSQTELFFADCWHLWFLLSSPNILFLACHLPGNIRDGIVLARDYAYDGMDLEILFPEPGEVDLDADPRDTAGEVFMKRLLAEDRERRRRKEREEQARREDEMARQRREREAREREAVRQMELEERRRQRARREEEARLEEERRARDEPDAAYFRLAAIFRRTARRWRPQVPEPEPELELARVKLRDPGSKGSRKVIAFYNRSTQTESGDFPGGRSGKVLSSSRYTSHGVQTDPKTEEKQDRTSSSVPPKKVDATPDKASTPAKASTPERDPQSSTENNGKSDPPTTPTPAPKDDKTATFTSETTEPTPPADVGPQPSKAGSPDQQTTETPSPRPARPTLFRRERLSRQVARSPRTPFGGRISDVQDRNPRSRAGRSRDDGGRARTRRRRNRLLGRRDLGGGPFGPDAGGSIDESPLETPQVDESQSSAPDTTSSEVRGPEDYDTFEEWLNSPVPSSSLVVGDGTQVDPFSQAVDRAVAAAQSNAATTPQDLPGLPEDDNDMSFQDLLGSTLGEVGSLGGAGIRSTGDLMDLDPVQGATPVQEQLATEMDIVDDSGVSPAGPLINPSPEAMDWETGCRKTVADGQDIVMGEDEAMRISATPSPAPAPFTTPAPLTTPAAPTTPSRKQKKKSPPALPRTPSPKDKRTSPPEPPAAPGRRQVDDDVDDILNAFNQISDEVVEMGDTAFKHEEASTPVFEPQAPTSQASLPYPTGPFSMMPEMPSTPTSQPRSSRSGIRRRARLQRPPIQLSPLTTPFSLPGSHTATQPQHSPVTDTQTPQARQSSVGSGQSSEGKAALSHYAPIIPGSQSLAFHSQFFQPSTALPDQGQTPAEAVQQSQYPPIDDDPTPNTQHPFFNFTPPPPPASVIDGAQSNHQAEGTENSQEEERDELEAAMIAAFEDNSDAETVLHDPQSPHHQGPPHTLPSTNDDQPPPVDPALYASTVPDAPQSATSHNSSEPDQPKEASEEELSKRRILRPRSRRSKDTSDAPPQSRQTSLQSVDEQEERGQDQAVMDDTAQNLVVLAGLSGIPVGDSTQPQQTTPVVQPSAVQGATVQPTTTRGDNLMVPRQRQREAPSSSQAENVQAIQMGGLTLPGGNSSSAQRDASKMKPISPLLRRGSILQDAFMTDSPEEMTPMQTPASPAASPKNLGDAELQRVIRRQQAKKGKKPQLFHPKRSNTSSSAAAPSPASSTRQGSTDTVTEAESSEAAAAAAQRLQSQSNSKKKVTVVPSSSVPQHLRDQERRPDSP